MPNIDNTDKSEFTVSRKAPSRLRTLTLCEGLLVSTSNNATDSYLTFPFVVEDGTAIEDIHGDIFVEEPIDQLQTGLQFDKSFDNFTYSTGDSIIGTSFVSYGTGIHTNRAKYGKFIKFKLAFKATNATLSSARVTVTVTLKYVGQ